MPRKKSPTIQQRDADLNDQATKKEDELVRVSLRCSELETENARLKADVQRLTETYGRAQAETAASAREDKRELHQLKRFLRTVRDMFNVFLNEGGGSPLTAYAIVALGGLGAYFLSKLGS